MNPVFTTGAILLVFTLCLSSSIAIAFICLKLVVALTTHANSGTAPVSRRLLAANWLRNSQQAGR